jgi:dynamin 1-like protein
MTSTVLQDGVDADKVQASEKTQKSRAILGRNGVNGIVGDLIQVFLITIF